MQIGLAAINNTPRRGLRRGALRFVSGCQEHARPRQAVSLRAPDLRQTNLTYASPNSTSAGRCGHLPATRFGI